MTNATDVMCIVVVNYGSSALLEQNFPGLSEADDLRVVVVDNYSGDSERARIVELCRKQHWTSVVLDTNTGFSGGVNAGLARARKLPADAYLLLNPDAVIDVTTARTLHDHVRQHRLDLVAPRVIRPDGSTWSIGSAVDLRTGQMRRRPGLRDLGPDEAPWVNGSCLAFSDALLTRIGSLSEDYFLYWEDVDLSMQVRRAGGSLTVREDLTVVHDEGGTQRGTQTTRHLSNRYYFYNCRNRLLFATRHLDRRRVLSWVRSTPRQSWQILLRGGRRQLLRDPRPLGAAIAGSLAGVRIVAQFLAGSRSAEPDRGSVNSFTSESG